MNKTSFEKKYQLYYPFSYLLTRYVIKIVNNLIQQSKNDLKILDVGGRKSHYSSMINGSIIISDIPKQTENQKKLNLGLVDSQFDEIKKNRSNLRDIIFDDMTRSNFMNESFDIIISIEVLEHVDEDEKFVSEVHRVLNHNGFFIMTTPNGDYKPIPKNPDHKRHYKRKQLFDLLSTKFDEVNVFYAIKSKKLRKSSLYGLSIKKPIKSIKSLLSNLFLNISQRNMYKYSEDPETHHLIAIAKKLK